MDKITFECELITPMFMYGADGKTPELRPSEFKGILRFWWRALHPDLGLEDLRKKEGQIFGDTSKKSSFRIMIHSNDKLSITEHKVLPHQPDKISTWNEKEKKSKYNKKAFRLKAYMSDSNEKFQITFIISYKYIEQIKNLFILSTILGGFGKRNRRGFGSIKITKINNSDFNYEDYLSIEKIEELIKVISPSFRFNFLKKNNKENYPFIRKIQIGNVSYNSYSEVLKHIGQLTHDCKCGKAGVFKNINQRFASPCYVSVIKKNDKYFPIITSLNIALLNNEKLNNFQINTISEFKKSILGKKNLCKKEK